MIASQLKIATCLEAYETPWLPPSVFPSGDPSESFFGYVLKVTQLHWHRSALMKRLTLPLSWRLQMIFSVVDSTDHPDYKEKKLGKSHQRVRQRQHQASYHFD